MGVSDSGFESLVGDLRRGNFRAAYVVGEDLIEDGARGTQMRDAFQKLSFLVVQDTHLSETAKLAHLVLPATNFAEKGGTYTNREGRVQRLRPALIPPAGARQDLEIFDLLLSRAGEISHGADPGRVFLEIGRAVPRYRGLTYEQIGDMGAQTEP
jgi:predicted molibdopterin-dependent oxidoreductase YjgC